MFVSEGSVDALRAKTMNSVVLAYIGDAVYTLCVRTKLALASDDKAAELERRVTEIVRAESQAKLVASLLPFMTEEEQGVYRRARNARKTTRAKHATAGEYSMSTGFEAVIGYLYLTGNRERLEALLRGAFPAGEL